MENMKEILGLFDERFLLPPTRGRIRNVTFLCFRVVKTMDVETISHGFSKLLKSGQASS